ncbi:MAG: aldo/keto reductase [Draconibacterium sp.]
MSGLNMNRRKFIGALGLGTAHLLFSNPLYAADTRFSNLDPLQKVTLGNSGIQTSLLGMGTGVHATNRSSFLTRQDEAQSLELLHHAYGKGIRYFDLADTYGTHQMLAKAMKKMDRKELTITTKIWERGGGIPENERPPADVVVDRFRKELNTDYIDLVQLHCMVDDNWTDSMKAQMDILENLKAKGIIRGHGVSVHSLPAMKAALESSWVDVIHVRINPYGIAMDKPDPQEVVEVIHQLHKSGKGVIGMKLVGDGKLRNDSERIDNALNFVLGLGSVDMMIIGFEEKDQIDNYIGRTQKALAKIQN